MQRRSALLISAASVLWLTGCSTLLGDASLTIDGKKQNIPGSVSCSAHAGGDVIAVGKLPAGVYGRLAPGGSAVEDLQLGNSTGKPLIAHDAKVSQHEHTYDITGEAIPAEKKDTSAPKPFELKVKCP